MEGKILTSLDQILFKKVNDCLYYQYTHIPCKIEKINGFREENLYKINTTIPIYRLFQPSMPHEDTYLHATSYFYIPYEDGYQTMTWKGYYRPNISLLMENKDDIQKELYSLLSEEMDCLIEHSFQQNYQFTEYHEMEKEKIHHHPVFYTSNVNIGNTKVIDDYYMEHIVYQLSKKNAKKEYIRICKEDRMESYVKNLEDYQMMSELLGEYGWNPNRRYLFKIADVDYSTMLLIS